MVVGRPNAGKSTLLNRILGQKVAIVTPKPQTTRNRILAVHNHGEAQIIFIDTPGLHRPQGPLGRYMIAACESALQDADVCVWLLDAGFAKRPFALTDDELEIAARLKETGLPILALLNKVDVVQEKQQLLPLIEEVGQIEGVVDVIPLSALNGDGVDLFLSQLIERLPESPKLYPEEMLSDQAERFFVAELIREALTERLRQELPYCAAVVIDQFVEETKLCSIYATIHVERASQRGIVIGRGGQMIKAIGQTARLAAVEFLGCPVDLRLHVEVSPGWTKNKTGIEKMGYE